MEHRTFGRTRERVSTIGMGTWRIGAYRDENEKAEQVKALRRGMELGINLIDTAEMYSGGRSEEVVGEAIKDSRKDVFIATKVSPDHLRHEDVIAACNASLRRLRTPYIDLYQVHWPNPRVPIKETMGAMEQLAEDGKIRYIGVSNFSVRQTEEASEALSKAEVVSNQVEYSLLSRSVEDEILPYCEKEKVALIAYSPLARGEFPRSKQIDAVGKRYGITTPQVMLNWVTRSEAVFAIPKSANLKHMDENAAALSVRFTPFEYDGLV